MNRLNQSRFGRLGILDDDQLRAVCPSIFADQAASQTSSRYEFIPTSKVVAGLRKEGWLPVLARETQVRKAEQEGFSKHMIRFRRQY